MPDSNDNVRCPVCKATQPWSDACRRCKCDLTFLRGAHAAQRGLRRRCLRLLGERRYTEAVRYAHRLHFFQPDADSLRLLAVCYLLAGEWTRALGAAQRLLQTE